DEVMRTWERWCAQLLEAHISYPQLAYYRSQHSNQSWLATLTTILDSTALLLARPRSPHARGAGPGHQAQLTFAMARHAVVDITQIFVQRLPAAGAPRWTPDVLRSVRAALVETPHSLPADEEFETRLTALRRMYEPYAQA